MDIESIMLHLIKKHLGAVAIHAEINHTLGEGTVGSSIRTQYLRKRCFADSSEALQEESETEESDSINNATLQALDEHSFESLR
jgi:hypothetical protein